MASSEQNMIPRRPLGRTGETVSSIGLGGFHIGKPEVPEEESVRIIRTAIDSGITFMDNSWDYHGGQSEVRMGKALRDGYRDRAFLMSKADGRDRRTAARQLDESLDRLQVDHIDLWQFHEIIFSNDPERIFAEGGALEAALEARDQGKVRYIGFTGHKSPDIHNNMLDTAARHGFRFDAVQLPLNVLDASYDSFERRVLPSLVKEGIGVLGMKPMSSGKILGTGMATPIECLHYSMSLPTSVVITGCDSMEVLQQALTAARTFRPMSDGEKEALRSRTSGIAEQGTFERYKTSRDHDSTFHNPQWLGEG